MGDFTMKSTHALPSWVPNWSSPLEASIQSRVESVKHYTACKNSTINVQLEASNELSSAYKKSYISRTKYVGVIEKHYRSEAGPMCLRLPQQGHISPPDLIIEPIMAIGETMWSDVVLVSTISSWLAIIAEYSFLLEKMIPREDFESTMCSDLVFDAVTGQSRRLSSLDRNLIGYWLAREVPDYTDECLLRPYRLMEDTADFGAQNLDSTSIRRSVIQATYRRRFFITAHGRIDLGPASMKKGDRVFMLLGGRTPFILRGRHHDKPFSKDWYARPGAREPYVQSPTAYELLGDCYVHESMDGEGINIWEDVGSNHSRPIHRDLREAGHSTW
ncbi:hypothetical protein BDV36DRAFT_122149 [Aspergillus pseudocaelatus]|uniref:Heterokaryon incompatibility domain-containing protein n=1 Tax=Aspergillus pseudocaelatus TaxID=1825620 RepID=A0ABQ6WSH5_9EURO|nr:hypothetical protein BDV36DRAFT_122149 [Aspergillus pseudocaelatus]